MKTKTTQAKIFAIVLFAFLHLHSFSQAPNWAWETNPYGVSFDGADAAATDASGNVYVTGYFYGTSIDFGGFVLTNASGGGRNMFIVKYDATGVVLWAESAGGNNEDAGYSVATDASNNVYVTGYFFSPSITFGSTTLINQGDYDMFIVKYDPLGTVLWARSAGRASDDYGRSVITDALNNVYVTGSFKSNNVVFGSTTLFNPDNTESTYDMYLVKYDSLGTVLWANSAEGSGFDHGYNTATDASGNIYVCGGFESDSIVFGSTTLFNAGAFNMYLAKYDSSGTLVWAQKAGGVGSDWGYDIATDAVGNVYLTGFFSSPTLVFGSTTLTNAGANDIFIAKYNAAGTVMWAKRAGELDEDHALSVATYASDVYISGSFRSITIDFFSTLVNEGGDDVFLSKIAGSGVGIEESNMYSDVLIYPNPSNGIFTINTNTTSVSQIEIYNVLGEKIYKSAVTNTKFEIDLRNQSKGVYFVQIVDEKNAISTKKIIIQ